MERAPLVRVRMRSMDRIDDVSVEDGHGERHGGSSWYKTASGFQRLCGTGGRPCCSSGIPR